MISAIKNNEDELQNRISRLFYYSDIENAKYIKNIILENIEEENQYHRHNKIYHFNVEHNNTNSNCLIKIGEDNIIVGIHCNCLKFLRNRSCEHLVACLDRYGSMMLKINEEKDIVGFSNKILKKYASLKIPNIKKEVSIEIEIIPIESEFYSNYKKIKTYYFELKVKIGIDKMYSYNNHQSSFIDVYEKRTGKCNFGVNFEYEHDTCFFNKTNERILEYINNNFKNLNKNTFSSQSIVYLLKELETANFPFKFSNHIINNIISGFPFKTFISENDENNYQIEFNADTFIPIGNKYEYVYVDGQIYHLTKQESDLVIDIIQEKIDKIILPKKSIKQFSKGILPIIKKQVEVEDKLKDKLVIISNPESELYFDLNVDNIIAKVEFIYDKKINYFDKKNIIRDDYYENSVINDITSYGFKIENQKIELSDINDIVYFLDNGLKELSEKYKIYTTENLKKINIKRKTNITSTFSIGQDNILSYKFELDGINENEVNDILKNIKLKKKYYRLNNGDILNLEDDNLKELNNLVEEMEITDNDIINGKGEILKYRAIYLDSIKNNKYHIIKTDNLFDNFIDNFYKYKDSELTLTSDELKILRDYQLVGVKWLYNIDKTNFGGILADEMGLGKTIQTIYYIKQILKEDEKSKFLIVVPTSLVYNWSHEFQMYAPNIKTSIIVGNKIKRKNLIENGANVFITTYGLTREDEEYYINKKYHAIIIDEAQNIKNPLSGISKVVKKIKSDVRFALTGTPIENSTLELWSIFDFIMPGYLSTMQVFQNKYRINNYDDETNNLIKGLSNQINPFILRRKKQDVVKELPSKIENNIYIDLSDEQKKMYVLELERVKQEIEAAISTDGIGKARFLMLSLLTKLRQICIDPKIVYENYSGNSNKIDRLISIITESISNNHKILVFTSFKSALNIVHDTLEENNIESYIIDGSVSSKQRMERVDSFNTENNVKVFLIMLKAGGTGLNLTGADIVIHLDLWWNPQAENQATDRAHRIGQKNVVEVIRLISKGTIEEHILELQDKKKELSDKLIDGNIRDKNILAELDEKDIRKLLSYENSQN